MVNPFNGLKNIKLDRTVLPHLKQAEVEHILKAIGKPRTPDALLRTEEKQVKKPLI
jgi:hypothetical protein